MWYNNHKINSQIVKSKKQFIFFTFFIVVFYFPSLVLARGLVPCGGDSEKPCTVDDMFSFSARIISVMVAFAGLYAITFIVKNGFNLVLSGGDTEAVTNARKGLANAMIGFGIVMLSFVLIATVVQVLDIKCFDLAKPQTYLLNQCNVQ